ncbi:MAG: hypothetical protein L0Z62_29720, partial [Gemmataceae bacterium]|nr:hypothetical protein [Gemmataceae bacterium]
MRHQLFPRRSRLARNRQSKSRLVKPCVELLEDRTVPSLVAAYGFNEGTGTTLLDSSGNGLNGVVSGATWSAAGKYGG